jgi:tetratricopeptide (TPR) repeat protein
MNSLLNSIYGNVKDTTSILTDIDIQIEATSAINKMYNYQFEEAEKEFRWLSSEYKNHPLPVFLLGLSSWWKIDAQSSKSYIGESQKENVLDKNFLNLMDESINLSKRIYNQGNKVDGAFFLAASYGFKGRLLSERRKWSAAAFAGRNAIKYLKEIRKDDLMIPEISFGNGLFNYYSVWISERYPLLKPIIKLFPEGNKNKGVEQLNIASSNSFYTRTEAQYFLMRIYSGEGKLTKALQLSKYLKDTYPENSIFHKYFTQLLYRNSRLNECLKESNNIIINYDKRKFGYNEDEARIAHFFLGEIYHSNLNFDKAIFNYKKSIEFSEKIGKQKMGYSIFSNFSLGRIFFDRNEYKQAKIYFKRVLKLTKRKDDLNKRSRNFLKKIK